MTLRLLRAGRIARLLCTAALLPVPAAAQVDQTLAAAYFKEAATLCERDAGRTWGMSLCGPMLIGDPVTKTFATNQPTPAGDFPRFSNSVVEWGGMRWATFLWQGIPANDPFTRQRNWMHELFHRIQPDLGLLAGDGRNEHLDTLEGRYWLELEWRALAQALRGGDGERAGAVRDALGFRAKRRGLFPGAAENERRDEIREGLAQYTGTVVAAPTREDAVAAALGLLSSAERQETLYRTFAYPTGVAYGLLLDIWSPGWTRRVGVSSDLGRMLAAAGGVQPGDAGPDAANRYGGTELRAAEEARDAQQRRRIAELRRRFVEGPVLRLPRGRSADFLSVGVTGLGTDGTFYQRYDTAGEWGSLATTTGVLVSADLDTLAVAGPANVEGSRITGDGWTVVLAPGWVMRDGPRPGDRQIVREVR